MDLAGIGFLGFIILLDSGFDWLMVIFPSRMDSWPQKSAEWMCHIHRKSALRMDILGLDHSACLGHC